MHAKRKGPNLAYHTYLNYMHTYILTCILQTFLPTPADDALPSFSMQAEQAERRVQTLHTPEFSGSSFFLLPNPLPAAALPSFLLNARKKERIKVTIPAFIIHT